MYTYGIYWSLLFLLGFILADLNGDGKQELLVIDSQKVFDGEGNEIASGGIDDWGSVYIEDYYPNNRYLCDFNGNGKTDILVMNASGGWIYELNGKSFARLNSFEYILFVCGHEYDAECGRLL